MTIKEYLKDHRLAFVNGNSLLVGPTSYVVIFRIPPIEFRIRGIEPDNKQHVLGFTNELQAIEKAEYVKSIGASHVKVVKVA